MKSSEQRKQSTDDMKKKLTKLSKSISSSLGYEKIKDPDYTNAKKKLLTLQVNPVLIMDKVNNILLSAQELFTKLSQLSQTNLFWSSDAPKDSQIRAATLDYIFDRSILLTSNFLSPRILKYFSIPFSEYQSEYERILQLKQKRVQDKHTYQIAKRKLEKAKVKSLPIGLEEKRIIGKMCSKIARRRK